MDKLRSYLSIGPPVASPFGSLTCDGRLSA